MPVRDFEKLDQEIVEAGVSNLTVVPVAAV
jgi:hypothetical protein